MAIQVGNKNSSANINVTPLIDVLLVILIIFMLLPSPTKGLHADVPQPSPENQPAPANPQDLVLRIQKDHSLDLNSQPIALEELGERLKTLFAVRPDGVLFVEGAGELEFADVATVIDIARGAGVQRIGLTTQKQNALEPHAKNSASPRTAASAPGAGS